MAVVLAIVLAACGGAEEQDDASLPTLEDGGSATTAATTGSEPASGASAGPASDQDAAVAFAQCMRDNGVDDFPDPTFGADGTVDFGLGEGEPGAIGGDSDLQTALDACQPLIADTGFAPDPDNLVELQDQLVQFAQCLRDRGLDVDDPDLSGGLGDAAGGGPFGGQIDPTDPDQQAALEACQDEVNLQLPGGGG